MRRSSPIAGRGVSHTDSSSAVSFSTRRGTEHFARKLCWRAHELAATRMPFRLFQPEKATAPPAGFSGRNVWRVYARVKSRRSPAGISSQPSRTRASSRPFLPHGRLAGFGCAGRGRGRVSWRRRQLVQAVRPDLRPLPALPFLCLR